MLPVQIWFRVSAILATVERRNHIGKRIGSAEARVSENLFWEGQDGHFRHPLKNWLQYVRARRLRRHGIRHSRIPSEFGRRYKWAEVEGSDWEFVRKLTEWKCSLHQLSHTNQVRAYARAEGKGFCCEAEGHCGGELMPKHPLSLLIMICIVAA